MKESLLSENQKASAGTSTQATEKGVSASLRIFSVIVYFACLAINAVIGQFGPNNVEVISNKYRLYVTPPSFFFFIIAVIYVSFAVLLIYATWNNTWPLRSYLPLNITSIANAVWIGVLSIGTDTSLVAASIIILLIPIGNLSLWVSLYNPDDNSWSYYLARNNVAFYLGWTIGGAILSFGMVLVYILHISQREFAIIFWVMAPLIVLGLTILNTTMQGINGFKSTLCLWLSGGWALAGALISTIDNWHNF